MKKQILKKAAVLLSAAVIVISMPLSVSADWVKNENGTTSYLSDSGKKVKGKWVTEKGNKYYIKSDGTRAENEKLKLGGKYYYFGKDGKMAKSKWVTIKKTKYYFTEDGSMAVNCTMDIKGKSYTFDKNGKSKSADSTKKAETTAGIWSPFEGLNWDMSRDDVVKALGLKKDDYTWGTDLKVTKIRENESSDVLFYKYVFTDGKLALFLKSSKYSKSAMSQYKKELKDDGWKLKKTYSPNSKLDEYIYEKDGYKATLSHRRDSLSITIEKPY